MYKKHFKRALDFIVALILLILLSPVYLALFICIRIKLGPPVIFRQERPGLDEKVFSLYKFRTMTNERGADGELLPDEKRMTSFGSALRRLSLDELPELYNIFIGDMSFVGPRPLLVQYLPLYNAEQHRRHEVRPGLSGLAQINGRNATLWEDRFRYDVEYVDKVTLFGDIRIILLTLWKAFVKREGISQSGEATMQAFKGNGR